MAAETTVKLSLPSRIRLVDLAHEASQRMAEFAGFEEDAALDVGLAVREAVINAITHGNGQDPARTVDVTLTAGTAELVATVRDHGSGFEPDPAHDPTSGDNRLRPNGRGLLLMRAYVDEVKFRNRKGRGFEVILVKQLRPAAEGAGAPEAPRRTGR